MIRGFKKRGEDQSAYFRRVLSLPAEAPLSASKLADHLSVVVVPIGDIPDLPSEALDRLTRIDADSWSAFTLPLDGWHVIIHNSAHSPRRRQSDLMHELAHIICEHPPDKIVQLAGFPYPLRTFNADQEDEAKWLGGCLQLPRSALMWAAHMGMNEPAIAEHFTASEDLVRYRRRVTGVDVQLSRERKTKGAQR